MNSNKFLDVKQVKKQQIFCVGQKFSGNHPKIFLNLSEQNKVVSCPYCSQKFVWTD